MSNFKGSQVDHGKRQQQQLTGSHAAGVRAPNTFPSHLDLLSPRSMGIFNNVEPPDSPPDAMDLVRPDFSEFENRNSGVGVGISPVPKSNLRLVRPQQIPVNNLARKSIPNFQQQFPANTNRPIPQQSPASNFDRRIVLEKRPTTSSTTLVPRNSGNNFSVQKSVPGVSSQPPPSESSSAMIPPKNTSLETNSSNKLSPQELERIRINRASDFYRLQREKFNSMNQPVQREESTSPTPTPSPPPHGIVTTPTRQGGGARPYQPVSRVPNVNSPQPVTSEAKLSTTATLRASRIVKFRKQNNQNSEIGGLMRGEQNAGLTSTTTPSTQTIGAERLNLFLFNSCHGFMKNVNGPYWGIWLRYDSVWSVMTRRSRKVCLRKGNNLYAKMLTV